MSLAPWPPQFTSQLWRHNSVMIEPPHAVCLNKVRARARFSSRTWRLHGHVATQNQRVIRPQESGSVVPSSRAGFGQQQAAAGRQHGRVAGPVPAALTDHLSIRSDSTRTYGQDHFFFLFAEQAKQCVISFLLIMLRSLINFW